MRMLGTSQLVQSVDATLVSSAHTFKLGEKVTINRVAGRAQLFGVKDCMSFLRPEEVDEVARQQIVDQFREIQRRKGLRL